MTADIAPAPPPPERQRGFLGFVERAGNLLPEPTMIFVYLIAILMVLSAIGDGLEFHLTALDLTDERSRHERDAYRELVDAHRHIASELQAAGR